MPPRPPPPPRILVVLCSVAALAAAWLAILVEQATRGVLAATFGGEWPGLELTRYFTLKEAGHGPALGAFSLLGVTLGGVAAPALAGVILAGVTGVFRTSGWFRALALELLVLGLLWLPTALAAAALPNGGGPILELYERLGDPPAGRWATLGVAFLTLWLLAGPAAARGVATGRSWMRADGVEGADE